MRSWVKQVAKWEMVVGNSPLWLKVGKREVNES